MGYLKKTEIEGLLKENIGRLHSIYHPGDGQIYTVEHDWSYTTLFNITGESGVETRSIHRLDVEEDIVKCTDDCGNVFPVSELTRNEMMEILNALCYTIDEYTYDNSLR